MLSRPKTGNYPYKYEAVLQCATERLTKVLPIPGEARKNQQNKIYTGGIKNLQENFRGNSEDS